MAAAPTAMDAPAPPSRASASPCAARSDAGPSSAPEAEAVSFAARTLFAAAAAAACDGSRRFEAPKSASLTCVKEEDVSLFWGQLSSGFGSIYVFCCLLLCCCFGGGGGEVGGGGVVFGFWLGGDKLAGGGGGW